MILILTLCVLSSEEQKAFVVLCAVQAYVALGLAGGFTLIVVVVVIIVIILYMRRRDSMKPSPPSAELKEPPDDQLSPSNVEQYGQPRVDRRVQMEEYHEPSYVAYSTHCFIVEVLFRAGRL